MVLNIYPYKDNIENCFDNNIISVISSYWNRDYKPYHFCDFNFELEFNDKKELRKIRTSYSNAMKMFSLCTSIRFDYHDLRGDSVKLYNLLYEELRQKRPIGAMTDSYDLPWNYYNGIIHETHFFLITGFEECSRNLIISDGYFSDKLVRISLDYFTEIERGLITFSDIDDRRNKDIEIVYEFLSCFNERALHERENAIQELLMIFTEEMFAQQVYDMKSQKSSSIVSMVNNVVNSRQNFRDVLNSYKIPGISTEDLEKMNYICEQWERAKNMILKSVIVDRFSMLDKGLEIIADLKNEECSILSKFLNIKKCCVNKGKTSVCMKNCMELFEKSVK